MTKDDAAKLRAPFPAEMIGKLPKPTKADNAKGKCSECGGWHGLPAVHLDYVGHAAATDRLLQVDPTWTWEPMAVGANGEPLMTNGGMWIKLTICGVTRPGFGDGKNPKEIISDAIRNAAMRFGVALDLWAKEDLHADSGAPVAAKEKPAQISENKNATGFQNPTGERRSDAQANKLRAQLRTLIAAKAITEPQFLSAAHALDVSAATQAECLDRLTKSQASNLIDRLEKLEANVKAKVAA